MSLFLGTLGWTLRGWMRLFHRLTIHGQENWPLEPPFVVAANHASHLDTLVLAAALPANLRRHLRPLAAADVFFRTTLRARLTTALMGALPFSRRGGLHQLLALRQRLASDRCVLLLYPEGTRSRTGRMTAFRHGLGVLIAGSPVPVVPCYLEGTFAALRAGQCLPRPHKLALTIGQPLSFADIENTRRGWEHVGGCVEGAVRRLGGLPSIRRRTDNFVSSEGFEDGCLAVAGRGMGD